MMRKSCAINLKTACLTLQTAILINTNCMSDFPIELMLLIIDRSIIHAHQAKWNSQYCKVYRAEMRIV